MVFVLVLITLIGTPPVIRSVAAGDWPAVAWLAILSFFWFITLYRFAYEVRLRADGTCVFRGVLRKPSVPAARIRSVRLRGNSVEFRYDGGTIALLLPIDGLRDLIQTLETLNPAIEIRGI
jgi:hypothetical protein